MNGARRQRVSAAVRDIEVTGEFARALRAMEQGRRHLLITGCAGTG